MPLRVRFQYTTGASLGYSIERLSDGRFFDFADQTFKDIPTTTVAVLNEDTGSFLGRYKVTLSSTPIAQFTNGDYVITIHNRSSANAVIGQLATVMNNGDDATVVPSLVGGGGVDPWSVQLPGPYGAGTAGAILGQNLDARVSTRSTYSGGPVASVVSPVVVGANNDKSGYSLAAAGLDAVNVEPGINARQALSPILAAAAGTLAGAGTGTITIRGANTLITRITASTDNAGNRSAVTLTLPA